MRDQVSDRFIEFLRRVDIMRQHYEENDPNWKAAVAEFSSLPKKQQKAKWTEAVKALTDRQRELAALANFPPRDGVPEIPWDNPIAFMGAYEGLSAKERAALECLRLDLRKSQRALKWLGLGALCIVLWFLR